MKLYIGNIPYATSEDELKELFSEFTSIVSCKIIMDFDSGRSKGFGFIEFGDDSEANEAIKKFNGYNLDGKELVVNEARPQEKKRRSFSDKRRY